MAEVTVLLEKIAKGDNLATEHLLPLIYQELRQLAERMMRDERTDHTLQATALVSEAYLRLVNRDPAQGWDSRGHFYSAAAEAMRRILVEHARRKLGKQRGGDRRKVYLDEAENDFFAATNQDPSFLIDVHESLDKLANEDPETFELIKLRYFAGLPMSEAAQACGIPNSTAYAKWNYARARLRQLLGEQASAE